MPVAFDAAGRTMAVAPMYAAAARDLLLHVLDLESRERAAPSPCDPRVPATAMRPRLTT